jgi:NTE family protein
MLGLLDFGLGGNGIIRGNRLADLMERNFGDMNIEDLDTRFAAIATELGSGHEIWLTRGKLTRAIHASYAMPGIFSPVKVAGRWLMDGAVVNPIPVSPARALGARVVIAVNLHSDVFGRGTVIHDLAMDDSNGPVADAVPRRRFDLWQLLRRQMLSDNGGPGNFGSVLLDAYNITQDRIARSRLAGDPPDLMIAPKLGEIGLFEFHRAAEAIRIGAEATERALGELSETVAALR